MWSSWAPMLTYQILVAAVLVIVLAVALRLLYTRGRRAARRFPPQRYSGYEPPGDAFEYAAFEEIETMGSQDLSLEAQPTAWRQRMLSLGERLAAAQVTSVVFVHGTFLGDDPFDMGRMLRRAFPFLADDGEGTEQFFTQGSSGLLGDLGNFTSEYLRLFTEALGNGIEVVHHRWSSANHHAARFRGALTLLNELAEARRNGRMGQRSLLIGHSHAGQVFSILSQMLASDECVRDLLPHAEAAGFDAAGVERQLAAVRDLFLDIVTLGTPPRYGWGVSPKIRVLHIINHRGDIPKGGSVAGLMFTRDGDYIQQYGIAGSDMIAPFKEDRAINEALDRFLGKGCDPTHWRDNVRHRVRVPATGFTYLVDYGDKSGYPNFLATLFGHGCYTRFAAMLFNTQLIADHFYPGTDRPRSP